MNTSTSPEPMIVEPNLPRNGFSQLLKDIEISDPNNIKPEILDFIDIGNTGFDTTTFDVDAETAKVLLALNTNNRTIKPERIYKYHRQMINGLWVFAGDPIRFDDQGVLLDGQHRLLAVALLEPGATQKLVFMRGIDSHAQTAMDQGATRSAADQLALKSLKNGRTLAAAIRLMIAYESGNITHKHYINNISTIEVEAWYEFHKDLVDTMCNLRHIYGSDATAAASKTVALLLLMEYNAEIAQAFLTHMSHGTAYGHPLNALSNRLATVRRRGLRPDNVETIAFSIYAVNMWLLGNTVRVLRQPREGWNEDNYPTLIPANEIVITDFSK